MDNFSGDSVDSSYEKFNELKSNLKELANTIVTEQDTRLKIIDPIFLNVLEWTFACIYTEEPTGNGFVDYKFSVNDRARLVVEAKKDGTPFGLNHRSAGRAYKLDGPVLSKSPHPREGILQAIRYCGSKNAELACVTNGNEWIIFRGSRLGDGKDTLAGMAFIFPSIDSIGENFKLFYDLLSRGAVESFLYRSYFQEAEGQPIRAKSFSKTLKPVNGYRLIQRTDFSIDIDRIMTAFFRRLTGDDEDEMLIKCFVVTKESQIADERLARIADELASTIKNLDTSEGNSLAQVIQRVRDTHRNEFVLLVGTKGAGKSTFTDRFFKFVLPEQIRSNCVVIRINVGESSGNIAEIIEWLNRQLLELLEDELFGQDGPSYEEMQGIFFDEYKRWMRGPYKFLYERDKNEFKEKFGEHIENLRNVSVVEYIKRLFRYVVSSRKFIPCIVFDNTDHFSIEFQEKVFQYARSIYETAICIIIIPITDKTSWQLSRQGALQSFESESFFLPTPLPKTIIEKRIFFIEEKLKIERNRNKSVYFLNKGIRLSLEDLQAFVVCLQQVFVQTGIASKWVGNFANNDIRRCLHIVRSIISSPYLNIDNLIKAYLYKSSISVSDIDIKKSLIYKGYNFYPTGQNEFVQNLFSLTTEFETTPLIALRVLRLLRDAKHHDAGGLEDFVTLEQITDYFQAIGIERRHTLLCLDAILKAGLCLSYDPTNIDIYSAKKVQLSPSGLQHLHWGSWDEIYIAAMLEVTPISDEEMHEKLRSAESSNPNWQLYRVSIFLDYLISTDRVYCHEIDHPAYLGQKKLIKALLNP